ncbi:uncharacterized protein YukE [Dietzia sp. 2505]|uniref:hypothetical protein n=1 Tax=Dietzia sp. 2505 TaxID=3156457 RepID=UPI003390C581
MTGHESQKGNRVSYSVGAVRRWDARGVTTACAASAGRHHIAEEARGALSEGRHGLAMGWEGVAADAVLDAADCEHRHIDALAGYLDDLTQTIEQAGNALGPAVKVVRDRIAEAQARGLVVLDDSLAPAAGRDDITQAEVDGRAEASEEALDVVAALDQHYGRTLDGIAARLNDAIPPEPNRGSIPGPDIPWPGVAVAALTRAMSAGLPRRADELDPLTRGRHVLNPAPDDYGRQASAGLRFVGKLAGPLGTGMTVYDGVNRFTRGEGGAFEVATETGAALGGGMTGGALLGASGGSYAGPYGALLGAGVGAAAGSPVGKKFGELAYKSVTEHHDLLLRQYLYAI